MKSPKEIAVGLSTGDFFQTVAPQVSETRCSILNNIHKGTNNVQAVSH
jgi:hypothetical protein